MPSFEDSYIGRIRKLVGDETLIVVATRGVICDPHDKILLVRRRDNSKWVMPSGALELEENIYDCLKREVWEESGLHVISATPMGVYASPNAVSAYGHPYYVVTIQFLVNEWRGMLVTETDETIDAGFFSLTELPEELADYYYEVIEDFKNYEGGIILKG